MHTAIIIDDMKLARANLLQDITDYCPEVTVIGQADGVLSGAKLIREVKPEIIFLDIEMNDGVGFDLLDIIPEVNSRVIFVTASNEFAIKAFQYAAVDYILKPADGDLLAQAVQKVLSQTAPIKEQWDLVKDQVAKTAPSSDKLVLHTQEEIKVAAISEIIRCESMGNYTQFYFADGTKLLVTKTLKEYDRILSPHNYLRTHQSHLVNSEFIKSYIKTEGGYILMKDGSRIPVSVRKKAKIVKLLDAL